MAKPPESTPHSDLDGVHQDEKPNFVTAQETGETTADLKLAREESKGKPHYSDDKGRPGAPAAADALVSAPRAQPRRP